MQPGPEAQHVGAAGSALQLEARGAEAVPTTWLNSFDSESRDLDRALADLRRRERLAADVDLITWLGLNEYAGPAYDRFAEELAKYGYAVMFAWIRKGIIFARCRERGLGGLPEPPVGALAQPEVAAELACETVAKALRHFRDDVLMKGRWDPTRGATIKTYFIGQCLIRFPNIYRSWLATEAHHGAVLVDENELLEFLAGGRGADPAELAVIRQEIEVRFKDISDKRLLAAFVLTAAGWSQREIAGATGMTEKAVERMLAYYREKNVRKVKAA
jgi:hypothetical protein